MPMRIVLDINVLVSGIISRQSPPGQLLALWRDRKYHLVVSPPLLERLSAVLLRPRLARFIEPQEADALLADLQEAAICVEPATTQQWVNDPKDNQILATAIAGQAQLLITGDKKHLVPLGTFQGIVILEPRQAIAIIQGDKA